MKHGVRVVVPFRSGDLEGVAAAGDELYIGRWPAGAVQQIALQRRIAPQRPPGQLLTAAVIIVQQALKLILLKTGGPNAVLEQQQFSLLRVNHSVAGLAGIERGVGPAGQVVRGGMDGVNPYGPDPVVQGELLFRPGGRVQGIETFLPYEIVAAVVSGKLPLNVGHLDPTGAQGFVQQVETRLRIVDQQGAAIVKAAHQSQIALQGCGAHHLVLLQVNDVQVGGAGILHIGELRPAGQRQPVPQAGCGGDGGGGEGGQPGDGFPGMAVSRGGFRGGSGRGTSGISGRGGRGRVLPAAGAAQKNQKDQDERETARFPALLHVRGQTVLHKNTS